MATVVVVGAGIAGLASALALADRGHDVRLLDREPAPPELPPQELCRAWSRPSVPQAEQTHAFTSLGVNLLRERAPDVYEALVRAGAAELDLGAALPIRSAGQAEPPYDPQLRLLGCRRKTFEAVLHRAVAVRPRVLLNPGTPVRGLLLADTGAPRVVGVRTGDGRRLAADIVVDATGWRCASALWLTAAHPAAEPATDHAAPPDVPRKARHRIAGYTRFYRRRGDDPPGPLNRGNAAGGLWSHFLAILHPGDNRTFTIGLGVLADDVPMRALRHAAAFDAAVRAVDVLAPWVAPGASEPLSGVHAIGFPPGRLRTAATLAGEPVQGLFPVGDAACVTSPVYGRGVSLALAHAYRLADVLDAEPRVGAAQSRHAAEAAEALLSPWHRQGERDDRELIGLWRATVHGEEPPAPTPGRLPLSAVAAAGITDPVVWRRSLRVQMCLDEPDVLYTDEEIRARVGKALARREQRTAPGPSRAELVALVAAAAG